MAIIDTHAHIYLNDFDDDREAMIVRCRESGVERILMPNIDTGSIAVMVEVADQYPEYCYPMMGIHPTSIGTDYIKSLSIIEKELGKRAYCAIGEIGIDLYWDKTYEKEQIEAFMIQLQWANQLDLPVSIHVRNGWHVALRCLREFEEKEVKGVFHCFSGSDEIAAELLSYPNLYMGIGGTLTYKNATLPKVLKNVPINRLVIETDAPYLSPIPFRGKRNESSYLYSVVEKLGEVYTIDVKTMESILYNNSIRLFNNIV